MNVGSQPATMAGQGTVTPKNRTAADFAAGNAVMHMTVEITRADTGKKDTVQITATPIKE